MKMKTKKVAVYTGNTFIGVVKFSVAQRWYGKWDAGKFTGWMFGYRVEYV
jgi:hypothetical protein